MCLMAVKKRIDKNDTLVYIRKRNNYDYMQMIIGNNFIEWIGGQASAWL